MDLYCICEFVVLSVLHLPPVSIPSKPAVGLAATKQSPGLAATKQTTRAHSETSVRLCRDLPYGNVAGAHVYTSTPPLL